MKPKILREALLFSSTAILGPILFLGGIGYMLDKFFNTEKVFLLTSIGLAFVITQVLMFKKVREFSRTTNSLVGQTKESESIGMDVQKSVAESEKSR